MNLALSLLGGALALDQTSLGQIMVSRPLVSATLTGWILGAPASGLVAGALLELLFLPAFPVGGARFPEGGPAGVVAAAAASHGTATAWGGALAVGVGLGAVWGLLGGWSITVLRRVNERMAAVPGEGRMSPRRVVAGHLGALGCDFLRGVVLTATGVAAAGFVAPLAARAWVLAPRETILALAVAAALSTGGLLAALDGLGIRRSALLGGIVVGALLGWAL